MFCCSVCCVVSVLDSLCGFTVDVCCAATGVATGARSYDQGSVILVYAGVDFYGVVGLGAGFFSAPVAGGFFLENLGPEFFPSFGAVYRVTAHE